jgi:hypothetical protein
MGRKISDRPENEVDRKNSFPIDLKNTIDFIEFLAIGNDVFPIGFANNSIISITYSSIYVDRKWNQQNYEKQAKNKGGGMNLFPIGFARPKECHSGIAAENQYMGIPRKQEAPAKHTATPE